MRFRNLKKQSKQLDKIKQDLKQKYHYARFVDRVKALITDMFMIYAPILYVITYIVLNGKNDFQSSQVAQLSGVLLYGIIYALLLSRSGQTPGKKAYEIKVVDLKSGENISFVRAFLRFIAFLFSATVLVGLFIQLFRKDNRTLHDLIARTVVIKSNN